jgi:acyl carrier protein
MPTLADKIVEIVAEQLCFFCTDAAKHESLSDLYHMDSLDRAEIILAVECDLGIELPIDFSFDTISQLIEAVEAVV